VNVSATSKENDGRPKHLTALEVDKLLIATKGSRNEARDQCLLLLMLRRGLHVSEACGLDFRDVLLIFDGQPFSARTVIQK
jgi:site-specific recombinase XerD